MNPTEKYIQITWHSLFISFPSVVFNSLIKINLISSLFFCSIREWLMTISRMLHYIHHSNKITLLDESFSLARAVSQEMRMTNVNTCKDKKLKQRNNIIIIIIIIFLLIKSSR